MAMVLLPPFFLPNKTKSCKSDLVGKANLTKHSKALLGRSAMSVKTCWSRPIVVVDGKERQALRISSARKPWLLAHTRASATCFSHKTRFLFMSLTIPMSSSSLSVQFRYTLRVCREVSLTVFDDERDSVSASSFPHHLWAGPAPPFNAWHSHLCVAHLLHSSPFWSARSDNGVTRSDGIWH